MRALAVTVVFVAVIGLAWGQQRLQQQQQQQQQEYQTGGLQYQQTQERQLQQVPNQRANQYTDPCQSKTRSSPHETQCDAYYDCHDSQPVLQYCPNGLAYQGKSSQGLFGVCDYDFNVDCSTRPQRGSAQGQQQTTGQPDPCQSKARVVGDETYCDRYWECINGQPQLFDCPNGLVFIGRNRGIAEGCDYPWRSNYCLNKQTANPPIGTEHCEWLYGIFGHETSCTRYWTCWNGTATEQFCIGGLLYNEVTHACDWPQNVGGCQKHPLCKDDPNANVPLGKSCERYWACQGGYPRLQRCPATLVFDRASRRCIAPPTPECDVPSTTPRPVQQERGQPSRQGQGQQGGQQQQQFQAQSAASQGQQRRLAQQQQRQPVSSRNQPQPQQQQFQQEQEQPLQEQFVDEAPLDDGGFEPSAPLEEQPFEEAPPRPSGRPVRPVRPQFSSSAPQLPFIPSGATPIQFGSGSGPRLPPIPGAIPIRLN